MALQPSATGTPDQDRRIDTEGIVLAILQSLLTTAPPWIIATYAIIAIIAAATAWRLSIQWRRHRVAAAARSRELLALLLIAGVAFAMTAYTQRYLQQQQDEQRLQAELQERDRIAKLLQTRIATEIDAVRAMLAERTVRSIERNTLVQARDELARFSALKDPRIVQMLALIDTELQIRALVEQSLTETAPDKLSRIFSKLAELAPDNPQYRDQAAHHAAQAASSGN